jgi:hypothetical protein
LWPNKGIQLTAIHFCFQTSQNLVLHPPHLMPQPLDAPPKLRNILKSKELFFHCGDYLRQTLESEIDEIRSAVSAITWSENFSIEINGTYFEHQKAYNKALEKEFFARGWETQPILRSKPNLKGDFRKGLVFVEVQFGNSSTLYRDYYKFQYGLAHGLLSLAVLIVPAKPKEFFPTRPSSVVNMAEFALAERYLTVLPIRVPTMLIGLLPGY